MKSPDDTTRHAEELLELGDALLELDRQWRIVRVNRNQERLSRKPREETLGRVFWEVWPETARPDSLYWREFHRCMEEQVAVQFEEHFVPVDLWTGVTAYPSRSGIAVFFRDVTALKQAEEAQARLAAIVESTDAAVISKDLGGHVVTWNPSAERLLGYAAAEIVGRSTDLIIPPRRRGEERSVLARVAAGELVPQYETQRVAKGGTVLDVSVIASPIRDREGRITGASTILRDVTAQRRAEAASAREHELLARLFERVPVLITVYDPRLRAFRFNEELRRVLGWTEDDAASADPLALGFPDPVVRAQVRERFASAAPGWREFPVAAKDGSAVPTAWATLRLADDTRVGIGLDLRERRRSEERLRAAEQRVRSVIEHLPSGLIVADLSTHTLQWNRHALEIHGYSAGDDEHRFVEALVAAHELRTLAGEPIPVEGWPLPRLLRGETFRDEEVLVRNVRLGWERVFSYSAVVLPAQAGLSATGLLAIQDVTAAKRGETELREANERLREADRRKDEFLGMLSHELRNPLAPIRNALYVLDHADPTGGQSRHARDVATRQVLHLTRLVDDLLDVTRIARGKIVLRCEDFDVADLARRVAEDHRELMAERGLELRVDTTSTHVLVHGDETRMAQVIGNLLNNAAKFTPAGGRVTLAARAERDAALLEVRDTGAGIEPAALESMFEPFVQAKQTLARTEGGLGLGLALVKGLVALHGGSVTATSEGAGRGARFSIALPLATGHDVRAPRGGTPGRAGASGRRVLVVDDNRDAAETLAEVVRTFGHEAQVAFDGPSALEKASEQAPDVVLCDIGLPGMDGYAVARALRSGSGRHARLVAVSGYAQSEDLARSSEAGFDVHIAKPADPDEIARVLGEAGGPGAAPAAAAGVWSGAGTG